MHAIRGLSGKDDDDDDGKYIFRRDYFRKF